MLKIWASTSLELKKRLDAPPRIRNHGDRAPECPTKMIIFWRARHEAAKLLAISAQKRLGRKINLTDGWIEMVHFFVRSKNSNKASRTCIMHIPHPSRAIRLLPVAHWNVPVARSSSSGRPPRSTSKRQPHHSLEDPSCTSSYSGHAGTGTDGGGVEGLMEVSGGGYDRIRINTMVKMVVSGRLVVV
jgi:hypothetical protein